MFSMNWPQVQVTIHSRGLRDRLILALARGLRRSGGRLRVSKASAPGAHLVSDLINRVKTTALDERTNDPVRVQAIASLSVLNPVEFLRWLQTCSSRIRRIAVRSAVVRALASGHIERRCHALLTRLPQFEPAVRTAAVHTLLTRADWTKALLLAASRNGADPDQCDAHRPSRSQSPLEAPRP